MTLPYYCTNCYAVMVNGICPDCSQHPTTTSGTTNDLQVEASKPPAPTVVETPRTDKYAVYCEENTYFHRNKGSDLETEFVLAAVCRDIERDLTAAQLEIERLTRQRDGLVKALEKIANADYRGNRSTESTIAEAALATAKEPRDR